MNQMNFKPCHHFIHLKKVMLSDLKTKGGLHIPGNISEKAAVFEVLAVGPGFFDPGTSARVPMSVTPGDFVLVNVGDVANASYAGQECLICPETSVFGVVTFEDKEEAISA